MEEDHSYTQAQLESEATRKGMSVEDMRILLDSLIAQEIELARKHTLYLKYLAEDSGDEEDEEDEEVDE